MVLKEVDARHDELEDVRRDAPLRGPRVEVARVADVVACESNEVDEPRPQKERQARGVDEEVET